MDGNVTEEPVSRNKQNRHKLRKQNFSPSMKESSETPAGPVFRESQNELPAAAHGAFWMGEIQPPDAALGKKLRVIGKSAGDAPLADYLQRLAIRFEPETEAFLADPAAREVDHDRRRFRFIRIKFEAVKPQENVGAQKGGPLVAVNKGVVFDKSIGVTCR